MIAHLDPVAHWLLVVTGLAFIAIYAVIWLGCGRRRVVPLVSWVLGVLAALVAVSPPIERLADRSFTGHMVQHLLLIVVSAPLLVLAEPVTIYLSAAPGQRHHQHLRRQLRRRFGTSAPVLAAEAFVGVLALSHLTSLYDLALRNQLVHDGEHLTYLLVAVGLWASMRAGSRRQAGSRIAATFAVIAGTALVSMVILSASRPLVDTYATSLGAIAALDDQRSAAALMWISGMAVSLPLLVSIVWRWATAEQRAARRQEQLVEGSSPWTLLLAGNERLPARVAPSDVGGGHPVTASDDDSAG